MAISTIFYKNGWRKFMSSLVNNLSDKNRQRISIHFYDEVDDEDGNIGFKIGINPLDCIAKNDFVSVNSMIMLPWGSASIDLTMFGTIDEQDIDIVISLPEYYKVVKLPFFYGYIEPYMEGNSVCYSFFPLHEENIIKYVEKLDEMIAEIKNGSIFKWIAVSELMLEEDFIEHQSCYIPQISDIRDSQTAVAEAKKQILDEIGEEKIEEREKQIIEEVISNKDCGFIEVCSHE